MRRADSGQWPDLGTNLKWATRELDFGLIDWRKADFDREERLHCKRSVLGRYFGCAGCLRLHSCSEAGLNGRLGPVLTSLTC